MNVEIKKLTPAHVEEYIIHFFETTPHDDNVPEHTCYCVCWCSADHRFGTGIPSREERRAMAVEYVNSGKIQGYLAYFDGRIVGWCNANDNITNTKTECLNQCHLDKLAKFNFYQLNVSYIHMRPTMLIEVPQIWFIQGYI
jgi:hypothetical protein